jgi:hypothetical protein
MKAFIYLMSAAIFLSFETLAVIKIEIDDQKKEEAKEEEAEEEAEEEEAGDDKKEEGEKEEEEDAFPKDSVLTIKASNKTKNNYTVTVYAEVKDKNNASIWLQSVAPKDRVDITFGTLIAEPNQVFILDPEKTFVHIEDQSIKCDILAPEEKKDDDEGDKGKDEEKDGQEKGKEDVSAKNGEAKAEEDKEEKEDKPKEEDKKEEEPQHIAKKSIVFNFVQDKSGDKCFVTMD